MNHDRLLEPLSHRGILYPNRIVFSPLTRARATSDGVPGPLQAEYYRQRASAGLLISEAIAVTPDGRGGAWTPGLYSEAQIDGWRQTTDAVHSAGGRIFAQLWHAGRLSHSSFHPEGLAPAAPAAMAARGRVVLESGAAPYETPRKLTIDDIEEYVDQYEQAARNAMRAGFDGVEIHGAHGYLLDSFLRDAINNRDDAFGGSVENRARFLVSVIGRVADCVGANRVAVRLSPNTTAGDMTDSDPEATFGYVIERMNALDVAWVDVIEGNNMVTRDVPDGLDTDILTRAFKGGVILNHGFTFDMGDQAIAAKRADMIAFGRDFIANPDLVERCRKGLPLATSVWYGGGGEGLIDFPPHPASSEAAQTSVNG